MYLLVLKKHRFPYGYAVFLMIPTVAFCTTVFLVFLMLSDVILLFKFIILSFLLIMAPLMQQMRHIIAKN